MSAGDVKKLPKWAQDRISQLESSRDEWQERALVSEKPDEESDTFLRQGIFSDEMKPLGAMAVIHFQIFPERGLSIMARIDRGQSGVGEGDGLLLQGDNSIIIEPQSSNSVRIKVKQ